MITLQRKQTSGGQTSTVRRRLTPGHVLVFGCFVFFALSACAPGAQEETTVFQEAEALYSAGEYDGATERYEAFLERYPRSPFAKTARLRLLTIDREIESVMGTRGTNRPILLRPSESEKATLLKKGKKDEGAEAQDEDNAVDPEEQP